jgi:hypothetical protein
VTCTGNLHANTYENSVDQAREFKDIAKEKDEQEKKNMSMKVHINVKMPSAGKACR